MMKIYFSFLLIVIFHKVHCQDDSNRNNRQFSGNYDQSNPPINETYDFIIIGAGNAGSVLANRLSEISHWKILLLEVGDEPIFLTDIPIMASLFQFTNLNWNFLMEKQENLCLGMTDQRMSWPKGRGLGGSTNINYMIHIRGNRHDYNQWAKLGNSGWSYKDVFRYFLKSENSTVVNQDEGYHSKYGPLNVQDIPFRTESSNVFVKAAQEAGYSYIDYNGRSQLGVSHVQGTLRDGKRCSAFKAYLQPIKNRKNLKISPNSRVTKILINQNTKQVYGVRYIKNHQYHTALASKEVILSAGTLLSPQLLMLSGIGPEEHLTDLGIKVLNNLPVGKKLYDHITYPGLIFQVNESIVFKTQTEFIENPSDVFEFYTENRGPLTTLGGVEALLYFKTNLTNNIKHRKIPDMEFIFISGSMNTDLGKYFRNTFHYSNKTYNEIWKPLEFKNIFSILPMPLHPKSYGHIELKSKNPYDLPKFYGNYFSDLNNHDMRTFIYAIRHAQEIIQMPSLKRYNCQLVKLNLPNCEHFEFNSDDYWECAIRHLATTLHHQITTCKMGPETDPEAVVDSRLRVYGIKNLRVIDASIIPITLSAHNSIPTYMVAEKGADLIKEDWLNQGFTN